MSKKKIIRFGLPKGSLEKPTIEKMAKAGYNIRVSNRSLVPYIDDPEIEIRLIRAQEISRYVELGYLDCGITGLDWIMENGSKVHEVTELLFSRATRLPARWVLCVPEESPIKSAKGLNGKRIATEVVNLTKKYLRKNGVKAEHPTEHDKICSVVLCLLKYHRALSASVILPGNSVELGERSKLSCKNGVSGIC